MALVVGLAGVADGEVVRFDAVLDTRCQEFVGGEPVSFDQSFEEFEVTSADLPLRVASRLFMPTADESLAATAQGFADFYEPRPAVGSNPAELALEANCFSIDSEVSYQVTSSIQEVRTIRLGLSDQVAEGAEELEQDAVSSVFLSGAIIVWSEDPGRSLEGLAGRVDFKVEQVRTVADPERGDPRELHETVFHTAVGVTGLADGEVEPFGEGDVAFVFGGPDLVRELAGEDAPADDFDLMGSVWIVLIPNQELPYQYTAGLRETFQLLASFSVEVSNVSEGTGISAVFGREFEALGELVKEAFDVADGQATQSAVNLAQAKARIPQTEGVTTTAANAAPATTRLCGAVGGEALAMLVLIGFLPLTSARRRRH